MNYTIKCNRLERKEEVHAKVWYNEVTTQHIPRGESHELRTFYHRRTGLSTGILQKGVQLSKDCGIAGKECQHDIAGAAKELYPHVRYTGVLSAHGAKEMQPAAELLSSRDVLGERGVGVYR